MAGRSRNSVLRQPGLSGMLSLLQFNSFKNGLTLPRACDKLPHQLVFTHPERQRDRPCEASATARKVPIPAGLAAWEMRVDIFVLVASHVRGVFVDETLS